MPETCWDIVKNKHLLHLVGFLYHFTIYLGGIAFKYIMDENMLLRKTVLFSYSRILLFISGRLNLIDKGLRTANQQS